MDSSRDTDIAQAPALALEAIRIAEQSARAAERSAAGALATLAQAEGSLRASEQRMIEITAAASSAASEATEARLRATEIATEFRSLEERVAEALQVRAHEAPEVRSRKRVSEAAAAVQEAPLRKPDRSSGSRSAGSTTIEFEALWDSFDQKADRIVERLKALEARTMTVIRNPAPTASADRIPPGNLR